MSGPKVRLRLIYRPSEKHDLGRVRTDRVFFRPKSVKRIVEAKKRTSQVLYSGRSPQQEKKEIGEKQGDIDT